MTETAAVQSMVTIAAPIAFADVAAMREQIDAALGNPSVDALRKAVEKGAPFLHFASLHAIEGSDGRQGHLVLEFSADGDETFVIDELARRAGAFFEPIFATATDWRPGGDIAGYWRSHAFRIGHGLLDTVGLAFCGTPRQSVSTIHAEHALATEAGAILADLCPDQTPLARLTAVRAKLAASDALGWALDPAPPPIFAITKAPTAIEKLLRLGPGFVATFLWPLILVFLPLSAWLAWPDAWSAHAGPAHWYDVAKQIFGLVAGTAGLLLLFLVATLGAVYLVFIRQEARDWLSERSPDPGELGEMFRHENADGFVQNHMVSHTILKPGLIRKLTVRVAFWAIARLTALNPKPGHLGDIGTIHFARWVTVPGTRDLLFFSNFGGSWESYLEDFITKAHDGLTAVWSNTVGFPRTRNLFSDGATDGERFKRYARASMVHTPFWYSAYPDLTTSNIRSNQLIRRGISAAMTEADAVEWLAHFGSTPRPPEKLETTQIQSLVFGGMGFKPDGRLILIELGADVVANRAWLRDILPDIAFNDGRYAPKGALLSMAVGPGGLERLGLEPGALASFPAAFLAGMHADGRDRILGDVGANHRDAWSWGRHGNDVALLVYGDLPDDGDPRPIDTLAQKIDDLTKAAGGKIVQQVDLTPVAEELADRKEPFGFVDGVSQPAMRGTYRGLRNDDPIHLVEPGEFVLGYPDNRGNIPPGPGMDAAHDPTLRLPIAGRPQGYAEAVAENPRLIGYNGSFLVIRQLEQHADRFKTFCRQEGERLSNSFPDLPILTAADSMEAYVGAKMIGRWQDGSSLVRNPYLSATKLREVTGRDPIAAASRPESQPANPAAKTIDAAVVHPPAEKSAKGKKRAQQEDGVEDSKRNSAITPDNDFLFGVEDPQGVRCPYGSHVRRVNPRESLSPGSDDQIEISNRHRIIRVGRGYRSSNGETGLMFMCLNGDIERQFEFIQQTWMGSTKFHGLTAEVDPIAGSGAVGRCGFTIPSRRGPIGLNPLPQFVTVRGGGYFFLPGRQLLSFLAMADS